MLRPHTDRKLAEGVYNFKSLGGRSGKRYLWKGSNFYSIRLPPTNKYKCGVGIGKTIRGAENLPISLDGHQ